MQDYFRDIEEWIPNYFFSKLCVATLRTLVYQYCMSLKTLASKNPGFQFGNELTAARHIMTDLGTLTTFFVTYETSLLDGGMGLTLDQELEPLARLARVISATHISGATDDVKMLCTLWGRDAYKLIISCINSIRSFDKIEKQECYDYTTKIYEQLEDSGALKNARADTYLNVCERDENVAVTPKKGGTFSSTKDKGSTSASKWDKVKSLVKSNKIKG